MSSPSDHRQRARAPGAAPRVRAVLFDVMDTLVVDPFFDGIEQFFGLDRATLLRGIQPDHWPRFERGEIDAATFYAGMFRDRRAVDGVALEAWLAGRYRLVPGVLPLVEQLVGAGVPCAALSNYPSWWTIVAEMTPLGALLDWRHVSCRTGLRKPDAQCFLRACETLAVAPAEALLVDDRAENCAAAAAVGLHVHHFADALALAAALDAHCLPGAAPLAPAAAEKGS